MFRRQNSETAKRTCDPDMEVVDSIIGQSVASEGRSGSQPEATRPESPLPRWWGNQGKENNSKWITMEMECSKSWIMTI